MTRFPPVRLRVPTIAALLLFILIPGHSSQARAQESDALPILTTPVNDFAGVIDAAQEADIDRMSRALMAATGDVVIVMTAATFKPYGSIQEYAVKLFENHGRGIGEKGKDNGLLMVLAVQDRQVWIEVGYGLEGFITDGFSGETSRQYMIPYFRKGEYGEGVRVGLQRAIARIAEGRNVSLDDVHAPAAPQSSSQSRGSRQGRIPFGFYVVIAIIVFNVLSGGLGRGARRRRRGGWGGGGWSGWSGGVGGFGGGGGSWGGGFSGGGGGGGGGFGGFGGGRSGGGGGGGSW